MARGSRGDYYDERRIAREALLLFECDWAQDAANGVLGSSLTFALTLKEFGYCTVFPEC